MKVGYRLFLFLFAFYAIVGGVYWYLGGEPLGITAVLLCAGLALIIGYYFWFINRRSGGVLPEDNNDGLSQMELVNLVSIAHILGGHFQWDLLPLLREWD